MPERTNVLRQLSERGFRETDARRAIVDTVLSWDGQFTARQLHDVLQRWGIGRATVFRTLDVLEELGVLNRLHTEGGCHTYTVCAEQHHHHLLCERCGSVQDFNDARVERAVRAMGVESGFRVREHHLEILGLCRACQAES